MTNDDFVLRPYQLSACDDVLREWETVQATAVVQATGLGKTVLAAEVIKRCRPKRVLFLAHRRELIDQAAKKISKHTQLECHVEMGNLHASETFWGRAPVVVSTVQTQYSGDGARLADPKAFDILIIDELHHYVAAAYRRVVEHYKTNPDLKVLGLTATPKRTDQVALGQIFDTVAHCYEIRNAIADGWLLDIRQQFVAVGALDYSHVRTTAGDLNGADLAAVMEEETVEQGMIEPILEIGWSVPRHSLHQIPVEGWGDFLRSNGKSSQSIVFCTTIRQAETFSNILNRAVSGSAAFVCEKTPKKDRARVLEDFASGKIHFVANVEILSEGYDNPSVSCIFMARPTKSLSKYTQFLGRGTRPLPDTVEGFETAEDRRAAIAASGKPFLTVIDFVGNSGRHHIVNSVDCLGGEFDEVVVQRAVKKAQEREDGIPVDELLEETEREVADEIEQRRKAEEDRKKRLVARTRWSSQNISPFEVFGLRPAVSRGWESEKRLSEKQTALLARQGIDTDKLTYTQARQLIVALFERWNSNLATFKQCSLLSRFGVKAEKMTMDEASQLITRIKENHWALPRDVDNGWRRPAEVLSDTMGGAN